MKKIIKEDPLEELIQSEDWRKGYTKGYRAGQDEMMNEMAGDFDAGHKKGVEKTNKYLKNVVKIANQWNIREIPADVAVQRIFTYLRHKIK